MGKKYVTGEWVTLDIGDVLTYPPPNDRLLVEIKAGRFVNYEFFAYAKRIAPNVIELLSYDKCLPIDAIKQWRLEGYKESF